MATKSQAPPAPLRLQKLIIEDFMRIKVLRIDADGNHIKITGPNGSGKTTAVDAVYAALGGISSKDMPEPVRRGAGKATIRADVDELKVEIVDG